MSDETIPKNLTFLKNIVAKATALMELRDFGDNLSGFLSQLVREEYERRHGPVMFKSATPKRMDSVEQREESHSLARARTAKRISRSKRAKEPASN